MAVYDVMTYGAVGDGVADETASIQAAIDVLLDGDTLYIPAGSYRLTETGTSGIALTLPDFPFEMHGVSKTVTTLFLDENANPNVKMLELPSGSHGAEISGMTLDGRRGGKSYNAEGDLIHSSSVRDAYLHDLFLRDAVSEGIDLDNASNVRISRVQGYSLGGNLIHIAGSGESNSCSIDYALAVGCSVLRSDAGKANPFAIHVSGNNHKIRKSQAYDCANGIGSTLGEGTEIEDCYVSGGVEAFKGIGATIRNCIADIPEGTGFMSPHRLFDSKVFGAGLTNNGVKITTPDAYVDNVYINGVEFNAVLVSSPNADNPIILNSDLYAMTGGYAVYFVDGVTGGYINHNRFNGSPINIPSGNTLGPHNAV